MFDDRGVVIENLIFVGLGSPSCRKTLHSEQIFCGVGNSVQRAAIVTAPDLFFGGFGFGEGDFRCEAGIGVEPGLEFFGAVEIGLGEIDWRKRLGLKALGEFAGGEEEDVGAEHGQGFPVAGVAGLAAAGADFALPGAAAVGLVTGFLSRSTSGLR